MKYIIAFICVLVITNVTAQNGTYLEFKMNSTKGMTGTMKTYCSASAMRSEMQMNIPQLPTEGIKIISIVKNDQPNTVITLDEKTKTYFEIAGKSSAPNNTANCVVTVIGKEKIGNYNCTHASVAENNKITEFWITTEIPDYGKYTAFHKGNKYMGNENIYTALTNKGLAGFPVKTLTKDERNGNISIELTKLEKQQMDEVKFTVPADYTKRIGPVIPSTPSVDMSKLQNMTPEERQKYLENLKKQYSK